MEVTIAVAVAVTAEEGGTDARFDSGGEYPNSETLLCLIFSEHAIAA